MSTFNFLNKLNIEFYNIFNEKISFHNIELDVIKNLQNFNVESHNILKLPVENNYKTHTLNQLLNSFNEILNDKDKLKNNDYSFTEQVIIILGCISNIFNYSKVVITNIENPNYSFIFMTYDKNENYTYCSIERYTTRRLYTHCVIDKNTDVVDYVYNELFFYDKFN